MRVSDAPACVWVMVRFSVTLRVCGVPARVCVAGVGTTHAGAQLLVFVCHDDTPCQAPQLDQLLHDTDPTGVGHDAVRVRLRRSSRV